MNQRIASVAILVRDYDEAIAFYVGKLGFALLEDTVVDEAIVRDSAGGAKAKRWVVVSPVGCNTTHLLLAEADGEQQLAAVGKQSGGRVFLFLNTDDFWRDHKLFSERGVEFVRGAPREEAYGTVAVFKDLYGNLWDLIEPAQ